MLKEKFDNVIIEMKSTQTDSDDTNGLELITEGRYIYSGDKCIIEYNDSEATGFEDSVTSIEVENENIATIKRTGKNSSNLVIEAGKKHHCHYETPYGDMMVGVYTHKIKNQLDITGGRLYMKYTIDINSSYVSDNEIFMDIKKL